mgnify:CR=1 FL=1
MALSQTEMVLMAIGIGAVVAIMFYGKKEDKPTVGAVPYGGTTNY